MSEAEILREGCEELGIDLGDRQHEQLLAYLDLLYLWNRSAGLTTIPREHAVRLLQTLRQAASDGQGRGSVVRAQFVERGDGELDVFGPILQADLRSELFQKLPAPGRVPPLPHAIERPDVLRHQMLGPHPPLMPDAARDRNRPRGSLPVLR